VKWLKNELLIGWHITREWACFVEVPLLFLLSNAFMEETRYIWICNNSSV